MLPSTAQRIASTAEGAVDVWMNSPGHRRNMLHENLRHAGVGVYVLITEYEYQYVGNRRMENVTQVQIFVTIKFVEDFIDLG
jgi:uncharacterized protein YkwD